MERPEDDDELLERQRLCDNSWSSRAVGRIWNVKALGLEPYSAAMVGVEGLDGGNGCAGSCFYHRNQ